MTFKVIGGRICMITTADYWVKKRGGVVCFMAHLKAGDKGAGKGSQKDLGQFKGLARGPG